MMKLAVFILSLGFLMGTNLAEDCNEQDGLQCLEPLKNTELEDNAVVYTKNDLKQRCRLAEQAVKCVEDLKQGCLEDLPTIEEEAVDLKRLRNEYCESGSDLAKEYSEYENCLGGNDMKEEYKSCFNKKMQALTDIPKGPQQMRHKRCYTLKSRIDCAAEAAGEKCKSSASISVRKVVLLAIPPSLKKLCDISAAINSVQPQAAFILLALFALLLSKFFQQ